MQQLDVNVVLVAPEIPQNTGAIGRLCVCTGARLHLVEPLGFQLDEAKLRRAGLDYWSHVDLRLHPSWSAFREAAAPGRLFLASTRGTRSYLDYAFRGGDYLVFGNETRGLPAPLYEQFPASLYRIPMPGRHARSLNLANAVAVVMYEALRQLGG